jgi:hypothetical protein
MLMFIYWIVFAGGQTGDAWGTCKKEFSFGIVGALDRNVL